MAKTPWETPEPSPRLDCGLVTIMVIEKDGKFGKYFEIGLSTKSLNPNLNEITRTLPDWTNEYKDHVLPALQDVIEEAHFLDFPAPDANGDFPMWEFFAKWEMADWRDYSKKSVKHFEAEDPSRVKQDTTGSQLKYVEKRTTKLLEAYPTATKCEEAYKAIHGEAVPEEDFPGFPAEQKDDAPSHDLVFILAFADNSTSPDGVVDDAALAAGVRSMGKAYDLDSDEVLAAVVTTLIKRCVDEKKAAVDKVKLGEYLAKNTLTATLQPSDELVVSLIKEVVEPPF